MTTPSNFGTEGQILYDANKKSKAVAYLLWFFFGVFGAHRLYMRQFKSGVVQLLSWVGAMGAWYMTMRPMLDVVAANPEMASNPEDPKVREALAPIMAEAFQSPAFYAAIALAAVLTIWWIVDAFLIPGLVRRHNEELVAGLAGR